MPTPDLPRDDIQAALEARRELGPEMEPAVVEAFVERMERAIAARVDARIDQRGARPATPARERRGDSALALAIVSLGVAIPLTAISAAVGFFAVLIVWLGIVGINWAYSQRGG